MGLWHNPDGARDLVRKTFPRAWRSPQIPQDVKLAPACFTRARRCNRHSKTGSGRSNMHCLEFRRRLLEDPYQNSKELLEHEASCPECATYSGKIRKQEASLRALLNSPAPPPELAENIRRGVRLESRTDVVRQVWFGAAASVLLVVGASMFSLFSAHYQREHMPLAQNVLFHINDEARHLHEPGPVSTQRVHAVLARFGAELGGDIGQIRFVAECVMRNRTGVHLIINGQQGPVTVFLMPGEQIPAVMPVASDRLQGEISSCCL